MQLKLVDNSIVNFLSFYAYNLMNKTNISSGNSLIFTDKQFGSSAKMLMSYPSKLYVVSLYHSKNSNKLNHDFSSSSSYLSIEDIEKIKSISLEKIDYLIIAERNDSTIDSTEELINNILFVTNNSDKVSYHISVTKAKALYSSLDSRKEDYKTIEFSFYKEVLGVDNTAKQYDGYRSDELSKKYNTKVAKPTSNWILCNNDLFYNILCIVIFIASAAIVGSEVYYKGITTCYPIAIMSVIFTLIFISILQYIRIDNNKKNK